VTIDDRPADERGALAAEALTDTIFGPVIWVSETGSTNDDLLAAASAGAPSGSVFVADHQRAGRGRRDRSWVTAPGDALLVSVLLDFDDAEDAAALATTLIATSAVEALSGWGFGDVRIKWPNDLVVGEPGRHRKLAGILAQAMTVDGRVRVVIGMGLNIRGARLDAEGAVALDQLERSVGAVVDPGSAEPKPVPAAEDVLVAVLEHFDHWWTRIARPGGREALRAAWLDQSATVGTRVRADLGDRVVTGLAARVTADGALVVEPDGGDALVIRTADVVSLRPVV
jgi:BirA family transcriptional regulator, biotin operon repressor / biotin---[acetyl-CoA-carboxylase] ligase